MSTITLARTDVAAPEMLGDALGLVMRVFDGATSEDKSAWRKFWKRLLGLEPGEMARIEAVLPRSGGYHRRHFKIIHTIFDNQEKFQHLDQFVYWLKVGAGWVTWAAGPKGGVVPIPRSVSYAAADQAEFEQYHQRVVDFLKGEHAAPYLWPKNKDQAHQFMQTLLMGFGE